jgi:hypothetical protein
MPVENKPLPVNAKDELSSPLRILKPKARCLIHDLRLISWNDFGILPDRISVIASNLGFKPGQIKKLMPIVEKFFTEKDGRLYYAPDEQYRGIDFGFPKEGDQ